MHVTICAAEMFYLYSLRIKNDSCQRKGAYWYASNNDQKNFHIPGEWEDHRQGKVHFYVNYSCQNFNETWQSVWGVSKTNFLFNRHPSSFKHDSTLSRNHQKDHRHLEAEDWMLLLEGRCGKFGDKLRNSQQWQNWIWVWSVDWWLSAEGGGKGN